MSQQSVSVLRLAIFTKRAKKLFTEAEIEALAAYLSQFPEKGDVIPGTKGLRKLRWSVGNRGKRGGSRVIYYYHVFRKPHFVVIGLCQEPAGGYGCGGEKNTKGSGRTVL